MEKLCSLGNNFQGSDYLNRVKALRSMTTPAYIISRYLEVADKCDLEKNDSKYLCTCMYDDRVEEYHYCPANDKFEARGYCDEHAECVDPISRCFDLDQSCKKAAKTLPEYKNECEEITKDVNEFAVKLLNECINSQEVERLLSERSGASRYFRFSHTIKYPRLYQAIEYKGKEFVGHMYCQQLLREQWSGNIDWKQNVR